MFYTIYKSLCKEKGVSASKAAEEAGISTSSVTKWKKGATPRPEFLKKLSIYFGVSIDYLLGKTVERKAVSASVDINSNLNIMIELFKQLPENRQSDLINIARVFLISNPKTPKAENTNLV